MSVWRKTGSTRVRAEARLAALAARAGAGPPVSAVDARSGTISLRRLRGPTLDALWRSAGDGAGAELLAAFAALGGALARVHALRAPRSETAAQHPAELAAPTVECLASLGDLAVEMLAEWHRDGELLSGLEALAARGASARALVHGDLTLDNVIVVAGGRDRSHPAVAIVDWELAGAGDPAVDLATVEADLVARWIATVEPRPGEDAETWLGRGEPTRARVLAAARAFRHGYGRPQRTVDDVRMLGAALLVRALAVACDSHSRASFVAALVARAGRTLLVDPERGAQVLFADTSAAVVP